MKPKLIRSLAFCLFAVGCAPTIPGDVDEVSSSLIRAIDNENPKEIREALESGARADSTASFGNNALHFASLSGNAELTSQTLHILALQKPSNADLANAISALNKESQSALEIAARRGNASVVDSIGSFCENKRVLRAVFFPVAKKLANESAEGLELIISTIARFGAIKNHMAHLIFETIGTKEGQEIQQVHDAESFLVDFAQAYIFALDAVPETQALFYKVASGFRLEKRSQLIDLMASQAAKDLYRNVDREIKELSLKFGVIRNETAPARHSENSRKGKKSSENENVKTPIDQNARLRDAVLHNEADTIYDALENGARIDALDADLRNVFHIAAMADASAAMTILLSQLQCSNAGNVLLQHDIDGFSPFALATNLSKEKPQTIRVVSEFMLSSTGCQEIAKQEIRAWAKAGATTSIIRALSVFSELNHGIEVISDIVYHLFGADYAELSLSWIEQSLCQEAKDHVWARIYFEAISKHDETRTAWMRKVVQDREDTERRQIVGFMLFLSSSQGGKIVKENILSEVEHLNLPRTMFEGSSDNISDLKSALDEIVTGQDNAKISLAVAVKNHYERVHKGLKKSNILILGPSGTGKTFLVETLAKTLDVPFTIFDATNITQAGYVGGKASDAVVALAERGGFDKEKIEKGIIFLDEIDKMASRSGRSESDEFKRQGQASLLKMLEGIEVEIQVSRFDKITIDTSNILFVCAGAFTGLPEIIDTRLKGEGLSMSDNVFEQAMAEDLIKYGLAPELLGRLPNVVTLRHLSVNDMVHILENPKSSVLEEYRSLFRDRGVEIKFTTGAIRAIAERAVTYNVGARALRTVAESVMSDLQFRIGQMGHLKSITITERVVKFGDMPSLEYSSDA